MKAIACELPVVHGLPLSRFSRTELHRLVIERGLTEASATTIWRWLHEDAIRPWQVRCWIFRRDPTSSPRPRECSTSTSVASRAAACVRTST